MDYSFDTAAPYTSPAHNHSFVFDGNSPFTEYSPSFTRATGGFFTYANGTTYFNRADNLGTPRLSTDYTGAVQRTEGVLMGPFGDDFTETLSTLDFTGFAGGFWDSENNGDHFGAREYQKTHGSWLSPDPAGMAAVNPWNPQTWNRYAYAGNNPTSFTDPTGLKVGMCGSDENRRCGDDPAFANTGNFGWLWNPFNLMYVWYGGGEGWYEPINGGKNFLFNSWDWYGGNGGAGGGSCVYVLREPCGLKAALLNILSSSPTCASAFGGQQNADNLVNKMTLYQVPSPYSGPFQAAYDAVSANNNASTPTWQGAAATQTHVNPDGSWDGSEYGTFVGNNFANASPGQQETIGLHEMAHPYWAPDSTSVDSLNGMYSPYGGTMGGIPAVCGTEPLPPMPPAPPTD